MDLKRAMELKKCLQGNHILTKSNNEFDSLMYEIDNLIASYVPSTKGMIWCNGKINPNVSVADIVQALNILSKFGQANLDDLGSPSDPNRLSGTPMESMFISQEDSKSDEWSPSGSQNQGIEGSTSPIKDISSGNETIEKQPENLDVDERMRWLTKLIENVKK